jgi:hypothetical protein
LSGSSSFSFSNGCLAAWSFSGAKVANLSATVGGQNVLYVSSTVASGESGYLFPDCTTESGGISVNGFIWEEILNQRTTPLNPQDPLADVLTHVCHLDGGTGVVGCDFGFIPGWNLVITNEQVTRVPEPGMLALMLLGLTATVLRRKPTTH